MLAKPDAMRSNPSVPLAIASGAFAEEIGLGLELAGIAGLFSVVVAIDDVDRGKPDPEGYLLAAERLGFAAKDCLVFEDAPVGIVAALAAAMPVVALTTSFSESHFAALEPPPTVTCADFDAFLDRHFA